MRTKITGRYVVGFDGSDHIIYEDGEVVFENDTILFVGHNFPGNVDETIAAGHALVSPGFIDLNALADIDTTVMTFDMPPESADGLTWSEAYIQSGAHEVASAEEERFKSRYALTHLLRNGITTALPVTGLQYKEWAETEKEFDHIVEIATELGLRTYLGPSYRSGVHIRKADGTLAMHWDEKKGLEGLEDAVHFIKRHNDSHDGLIRGLLVPSTIETCTTELLRKTRTASDELDVPIRLHAAQGWREFELIQKWYGKTPIQYLNEIGFLGSRTFIPHGIYVNGYSGAPTGEGPDLDILSETGTVIVHCPFPIARSGVALESFSRFRKHGIQVAMGTDCYPADMIISMRVGALMCRFVEKSPYACHSGDFFRAATLDGARALQREDLGRLATGAKADIIIVDLDNYHIAQVDDPIRTLILNGFGTDVKTVIINGNIVMKDGQIPGVDLNTMHQRAQLYYENMKESFSERDYRKRSTEHLFPTQFRIVQRR